MGQPITEKDFVLDDPPFNPAIVSELLSSFGKAVRAHQLYLPNNPMLARAIDSAKSNFALVWRETDSLTLQVTEADLRWEGRPLLAEPDRTSDSIPWMLYKDGLRELAFRQGFEESEMLIFLTLMQRARLASVEDDDLLTLLWEHDFAHLQYKYVELGSLFGASVESTRGDVPERIVAPEEIESEVQMVASSSVA